MNRSERRKMQEGDWYCCIDDELDGLRRLAAAAVHEHNRLPPDQRGNISPLLAGLLGAVGQDCRIEAPFHCPYGFNIWLGNGVYMNAGCTILDTATVRVGDGTMFGPNVHIYCAEHHRDVDKRRAGLEIARPVIIGPDAWIGGGAIILAGVTIGRGAIVGAGSLVNRDVGENVTVAGNPARPLA